MTAIYHITHIRNLPAILRDGYLWCDNECRARRPDAVGIAHAHIKQRRANRPVPLGRGGTLADYVPFYFAPRSPMLYAVHKGNVKDYNEGQEPILHLVAEAEEVAARNLPFVFTNGHAEMLTCTFYEQLADLDKVDWGIMKATFWNDSASDGARKWRRQAEFLAHQSFPVSLVKGIGVISKTQAVAVQRILAKLKIQIPVAARPLWYYQ